MRVISCFLLVFCLLGTGSCTNEVKEKSVEDLWKEVSPSIVYVTARNLDGEVSQGSGFFVKLDGKGWVLTNRHVVKGADEVSVAPQGKNPKRAPSYKLSPDLDLAVIECPVDLDARPLPLAKRQLNPGAEVYALGFPLGLANVISRGIVGAVEDTYFLFDAAISSGNSGGPIVNRMGQVVGVATMGSHSTGQTVVQNLNVGIRVTAIPQLHLFADPLLRISNVSATIRETEQFIEQGFGREDFLTLGELVSFERWQQIADAHAGNTTVEWQKKSAEIQQKRRNWQTKHGSISDGVARWIAFLKTCETRINAIPTAFVGLGNDPLLTQFLKDDRAVKVVDVLDATPEILPKLARISADHWLARFEDLRYHLEWLVRYSTLPSEADLEPSNISEADRQRPEIRLKCAITGNRDNDLIQYRKTLLKWANRDDVFKDGLAALTLGGQRSKKSKPTSDPILSEKFHGGFIERVSSLWQYLAIATADHGNIPEAIKLLRRDLNGRSASYGSGRLLAEYLVCIGKFDDAWQAYREHCLADPPFNAYDLSQRSIGLSQGSLAWSDFAQGIDFSVEFQKFPDILLRVDDWNAKLGVIEGQRLKGLRVLEETLASDWFKRLDDLSKMRVLFYYRYTRPHDEELEYHERTQQFLGPETRVQHQEAFQAALHTVPEAEALWNRVFIERSIEFPL
jgi:Trypsin-like peptidase domain